MTSTCLIITKTSYSPNMDLMTSMFGLYLLVTDCKIHLFLNKLFINLIPDLNRQADTGEALCRSWGAEQIGRRYGGDTEEIARNTGIT